MNINLYEDYKSEVSRGLLRLLVKSIFLTKYFYMFYSILNLKLNNNVLTSFFMKRILTYMTDRKYTNAILVYYSREEFENIIKNSLEEVINSLEEITNKKYDPYSEFLNELEIRDVVWGETDTTKQGIFYLNSIPNIGFLLERYIKVDFGTEQLVYSREELDSFEAIDEALGYYAGLRLVYFPKTKKDINVSSMAKNERLLIRKEKDQYGQEYIFNPISLIKYEVPIPINVIDVIKSDPNQWESFKAQIEQNIDYKKLFEYIFPIKIFNLLKINKEIQTNELFNKIIQSKNIFSSLEETIMLNFIKINNLHNPQY